MACFDLSLTKWETRQPTAYQPQVVLNKLGYWPAALEHSTWYKADNWYTYAHAEGKQLAVVLVRDELVLFSSEDWIERLWAVRWNLRPRRGSWVAFSELGTSNVAVTGSRAEWINGDSLDNRRSNLVTASDRRATKTTNIPPPESGFYRLKLPGGNSGIYHDNLVWIQLDHLGESYTVVDRHDLELVENYRWINHPTGRVVSTRAKVDPRDSGTVYLHRLVAGAPIGKRVYHRDRDLYNNRADNLVIGTRPPLRRS